jgi:WD40 repeat protein
MAQTNARPGPQFAPKNRIPDGTPRNTTLLDLEARLIGWPGGRLLGRRTFKPSLPSEVIDSGFRSDMVFTPPEGDVVDWVSGLLVGASVLRTGEVERIAISARGNRLAISAFDTGITVVDLTQSEPPKQVPGINSATNFAFRPDGAILAVYGGNRLTRLWQIATGKDVDSWTTEYRGSLAFSADGTGLWEFDLYRGRARLLEIRTKRILAEMDIGRNPWALAGTAFSPDGRIAAFSVAPSGIRILSLETRQDLWRLEQGLAQFEKLAMAGDGRTLVTLNHNTIAAWDILAKALLRSVSFARFTRSDGIAVSADGSTMAAGGNDSSSPTRAWDIRSGSILFERSIHVVSASQVHVALSPTGDRLAVSLGKFTRVFPLARAAGGR